MKKKSVVILSLLAVVITGVVLYYFQNNQTETIFIGFDTVSEFVFADVKETLQKDREGEQRIPPGPQANEVRLLSYKKSTWTNDCLSESAIPVGSNCTMGEYVGWTLILNIDGEVQEWKRTEDGRHGSINVGSDKYPSETE